MGRFSAKTKTEYKLSQESADAAVVELLDYYGLDVDAMPEGQRAAVENVSAKLSGFYRRGLLENVRDGSVLKVKQHLQDPPGDVRDITYGRATGAARVEMDKLPQSAEFRRTYALMGSICGLGPAAFDGFGGIDLAVVEALSLLFLAG